MANPEQLIRLKDGVEGWNCWRKNDLALVVDLSGADLNGADLNGANLSYADLSYAHLSKAGLRYAHLSRASLRYADLREADLRHADLRSTDLHYVNLGAACLAMADLREAKFFDADLREADLRYTNLSGAELRGAELSRASLRKANLTGANLRRATLIGAELEETIFADTNLNDALGLDACQHSGPSTFDHRTIAKSGRLPIIFLRGCGLPDKLIDYLPSLLNDAIQFYSCFISYSSRDQEFADRIHADLQSKGVRCWFAPHNIQGGKKLHEQIDEAIRLYDRLLLILSEHSMESEWVKTEIAKARRRETREGRRMLFPVRLVNFDVLRDWNCFDADTGKDSAREVREYYVPDFSNWKNHDLYQKEFDRLLLDLKAEEAA